MADDLAAELRLAMRAFIASAAGPISAGDLDEFGWSDLLDADPALAVSVAFAELGRAAARSDALDVLVQRRHTGVADAPATLLIVAAEDADLPPASGGPVSGHVTCTLDAPRQLVAFVDDPGAPRAALLDADCPQLNDAAGIDPAAGVRTLRATAVVRAELDGAAVAAEIHRALAWEQLGLCAGMLDVAVEHVRTREQFGRPIGSFQAVQHRLAEAHVAVVAATAALAASALAAADDEGTAVALAYALAVRAADVTIGQAMQVCGGMGFAEEFPLARFVRRAVLRSELFAAPGRVLAAAGAGLIATRTVPRLVEFPIGEATA